MDDTVARPKRGPGESRFELRKQWSHGDKEVALVTADDVPADLKLHSVRMLVRDATSSTMGIERFRSRATLRLTPRQARADGDPFNDEHVVPVLVWPSASGGRRPN